MHWAGIDWSNKRILDIGADVGSTAAYFLSQGALIVYAVEPNPPYFQQLQENARVYGDIIAIQKRIDSPQDLVDLLLETQPDIVKIDCETCELNLLGVDDTLLCKFEFIIETHSNYILQKLAWKLQHTHNVSSRPYPSFRQLSILHAMPLLR